MDFYPLAAGPNANAVDFLKGAILALQMILVVSAVFLLSVAMLTIVRLMIAMLPVVKTVVVGP